MLSGIDFLAFLASSPIIVIMYVLVRANVSTHRNMMTCSCDTVEADETEKTFGSTFYNATETVRQESTFSPVAGYCDVFFWNIPVLHISCSVP